MNNEFVAEKHERSLAVSQELLNELSVLYAELALYRQPGPDMPTCARTLCKLAHALGVTKPTLLMLRQACDNLAWTWCQPGHSEDEKDRGAAMRVIVITIDAMRRQWLDVVPKSDPPV